MSRRWGCWPWVEPLLRMIELIVDECCAGGRRAGLRPGCRLDPQCGKHSGGGRGERLHRCLGIGGPWALASLLWPRWSPISGGSCLLSRHCGREGGWDGGLCGQQPAHGNLLRLFPGGLTGVESSSDPRDRQRHRTHRVAHSAWRAPIFAQKHTYTCTFTKASGPRPPSARWTCPRENAGGRPHAKARRGLRRRGGAHAPR